MNATAVKKPVNSVDVIASCVESFIVISLIDYIYIILHRSYLECNALADELGEI